MLYFFNDRISYKNKVFMFVFFVKLELLVGDFLGIKIQGIQVYVVCLEGDVN